MSDQHLIDKEAQGTLGFLLSKRYLEHTPINGNYPSIDGLLQFINDNKSYTGKHIHYQLKGKAKLKTHTFPCKVSDLQFWADSRPPVIFILVDNHTKTAFWQKIDRRFLRSLNIRSGQKNKTIKINPSNSIEENSSYISEWYSFALAEDNFVADEWGAVVNNIEEKIKEFLGIFYLLAPVQDGDNESIKKIKEKLVIENREFTILLYECLKRGFIKSVGRILLASDEKPALTEVADYISNLSKKDVRSIISMARDENQKSVILKKIAEVKNKNSEEVLEDIAEEYLRDIKKKL